MIGLECVNRDTLIFLESNYNFRVKLTRVNLTRFFSRDLQAISIPLVTAAPTRAPRSSEKKCVKLTRVKLTRIFFHFVLATVVSQSHVCSSQAPLNQPSFFQYPF